MITNFNQLDLTKKYSYADYLTWQFDEMVELIKGIVFKMSPAPNTKHQKILGNFMRPIANFLHKKDCQYFIAPFDVRLSKTKSKNEEVFTVVQPDFCVICDESKIDEKGCYGAPDLIIEVLSKATSKKDLKEKFNLYEENGVKEYWVVYPDEETLTIFSLDDRAKYSINKIYVNTDKVHSAVLKGLEIDLEDVFY